MLNRERGALPLYRQLEIIIKDSIDNGEYSAGDILPAESDYMKLYEISRITVLREKISEEYKELC